MLGEQPSTSATSRTDRPELAMRREGRPRSRFAPFGWRTADGSVEARRGDRRPLVRHPAEQCLLRLIEDLRAEGLGARER